MTHPPALQRYLPLVVTIAVHAIVFIVLFLLNSTPNQPKKIQHFQAIMLSPEATFNRPIPAKAQSKTTPEKQASKEKSTAKPPTPLTPPPKRLPSSTSTAASVEPVTTATKPKVATSTITSTAALTSTTPRTTKSTPALDAAKIAETEAQRKLKQNNAPSPSITKAKEAVDKLANEKALANKLERQKKAKAELASTTIHDDSEFNEIKDSITTDDKARAEAEANKKARENLAKEQAQAIASQQAAALAIEKDQIAQYSNKIQRSIKSRWHVPADNQESKAEVRITILPGGEVASVVIVSSTGDSAFDASLKSAIESASPLPVPEDVKLFQKLRLLRLKFKPD